MVCPTNFNPALLAVTVIALLLAFTMAGCKSKKIDTRKTIEEAPRIASVISIGDAKVAPQLVRGFHHLEDNSWRWTEREFTVALGIPPGAAKNGAVLALKLTVPPVVIEHLKQVSLAASIDGSDLARADTFNKPGEFSFRRDVAAAQLPGQSVQVNFRLDKAMHPGGGDLRELGIIVTSAALESK